MSSANGAFKSQTSAKIINLTNIVFKDPAASAEHADFDFDAASQATG
jgi:hypothetical protein